MCFSVLTAISPARVERQLVAKISRKFLWLLNKFRTGQSLLSLLAMSYNLLSKNSLADF